ncbi:MAG TPA: 23S rRNA (adenine(2503)-C(2))-methyltransferase RlmN [Acholeplasmatales bacterium]|nr:23S rRNA (adenine(2503)-C(2))-methyltransferase RlmN [Acholeplasmatales bacterium]
MKNIYDLTLDDLKKYFISIGLKPFRAIQVYEWLYRFHVRSFDLMTNIKKEVIEHLKQDFEIKLYEVVDHQKSADGTEKFLFRLQDGNLIESVLMRHNYGTSICVTSEVGCNMGCAFCASGMKKKLRNLSAGEMVLQLESVYEVIKEKISHIVVMGIGEPFDNYQNVINFLHIVNEPHGLEIGSRHISVSTCGLVPMIYEYAKEDLQSNLAISLHAPNNEIRDQIMPINKAYRIEELVKAILDYIIATNRRVTIEYILIDGLNDSIKCANELADLLHGLNVYINLIPYNEVKEKPFKRSKKEQMRKFYDTLKKRSMNVTLRLEQGADIDAACGQLRSKHMNNN